MHAQNNACHQKNPGCSAVTLFSSVTHLPSSCELWRCPRFGLGMKTINSHSIGHFQHGSHEWYSHEWQMVSGLHLYSASIQSAVQCMPLIHPFTHTFTHQRRLAAMQSTNQQEQLRVRCLAQGHFDMHRV